MILTYVIDGDDFEYEPDYDDLKRFCEWCFEDYSREDFIDLFIEGTILEDYYDELWGFFEDDARDLYKNARLLRENPYNQSDFI